MKASKYDKCKYPPCTTLLTKTQVSFCSKKCQGLYLKDKNPRIKLARKTIMCLICNKKLEVINTSIQQYCSYKCHKQSLKGAKRPDWSKRILERWNNGIMLRQPNSTSFKRGNISWNKGLTKETDERVAKLAEITRQRSPVVQKGYKFTSKHLKNSLGKRNGNPHGSGKSGYREDVGHSFRSRWEANFARILNFMEVRWEYEQKRFMFEDCSYLPDFYLPELDIYIEVKGFLRDKGLRLLRMSEKYPDIVVKVVDEEVYKNISIIYKSLINNWEE